MKTLLLSLALFTANNLPAMAATPFEPAAEALLEKLLVTPAGDRFMLSLFEREGWVRTYPEKDLHLTKSVLLRDENSVARRLLEERLKVVQGLTQGAQAAELSELLELLAKEEVFERLVTGHSRLVDFFPRSERDFFFNARERFKGEGWMTHQEVPIGLSWRDGGDHLAKPFFLINAHPIQVTRESVPLLIEEGGFKRVGHRFEWKNSVVELGYMMPFDWGGALAQPKLLSLRDAKSYKYLDLAHISEAGAQPSPGRELFVDAQVYKSDKDVLLITYTARDLGELRPRLKGAFRVFP